MLCRTMTAIAGIVAMALSAPSWAGPIFLTGHDPDFHAQDNAGAANLLRTGLSFVTGGTYNLNDGNKFLWVESRIAPPVGHRTGELALTGALGLTLGTHFDRANGAEFAGVNLSNYTAIAIASSFGGLLGRAELDALIVRKSDIETFVNANGGLFASSECFPCGQSLLAGTPAPDLFGYLPVNVTSIGAAPPFNPTAIGAASPFNLTFADLNSATHNSFGVVGGLDVLDTDNAGNATTLAGVVTINTGGGGFTPSDVPEPGTLALLGFGLAGLGLARRRKPA